MQFSFSHPFPNRSPHAVEHLYFDETINAELCAHIHLGRQLLSCTEYQEKICRRVQIEPLQELPAIVRRWLKTRKLFYIEEVNYCRGSLEGSWHIESSIYPEKIQCRGRFYFVEDHQLPGCIWRTEGEITVAIYGIGTFIEDLIIKQMRESYTKAANYMRNLSHPST
jgi:hypothetical protein